MAKRRIEIFLRKYRSPCLAVIQNNQSIDSDFLILLGLLTSRPTGSERSARQTSGGEHSSLYGAAAGEPWVHPKYNGSSSRDGEGYDRGEHPRRGEECLQDSRFCVESWLVNTSCIWLA